MSKYNVIGPRISAQRHQHDGVFLVPDRSISARKIKTLTEPIKWDIKSAHSAINIRGTGNATQPLIHLTSNVDNAKIIKIDASNHNTGLWINTSQTSFGVQIYAASGSAYPIAIENYAATTSIRIRHQNENSYFLSFWDYINGITHYSFSVNAQATIQIRYPNEEGQSNTNLLEFIPFAKSSTYPYLGTGLLFKFHNANQRISVTSPTNNFLIPLYKYTSEEHDAHPTKMPVIKTSILRIYKGTDNKWHVEKIHDEIGMWKSESGWGLDVTMEIAPWSEPKKPKETGRVVVRLSASTRNYYPELIEPNLIAFYVCAIQQMGEAGDPGRVMDVEWRTSDAEIDGAYHGVIYLLTYTNNEPTAGVKFYFYWLGWQSIN